METEKGSFLFIKKKEEEMKPDCQNPNCQIQTDAKSKICPASPKKVSLTTLDTMLARKSVGRKWIWFFTTKFRFAPSKDDEWNREVAFTFGLWAALARTVEVRAHRGMSRGGEH